MKYIKPPDFKSVREFKAHYEKVEREITELLIGDGSASTAKELNEKLSQALSAATSYLANVNRRFSKNELPTAFKEGKDSIKDPPKVSAKEVSETLEKQGFKYAKNGFSRDTYIELQTATQAAGNGLKTRVNSIIKDLSKTGQDSVYNVQRAIANDLRDHGLFTVEYSNGAKQSLLAYAAMAARSARIESTNIGAIGRALQAGTDLVKMTTMPQCCKLCGAYQGKVYSISGKDKRFPALFKTVLRNGYALPHPNCRHEFIPYFEEIEDPADVEKAIERSRIKYDKNGELVDVRFQKDIKGYAAWQAGNRQLNREALEYDQMKAYYAGREDEMPYKSLGAFRRARRANDLSPAFKMWKYRKRDQAQYEDWKSKIGATNMPESVDKFQEIKYNNQKEFSLLKGYKEAQQKQDIHALVSFKVYKVVSREIDKALVGKTFDGIMIKGKLTHFIDRVIGEYQESDYKQSGKRQGVKIIDIVDCLQGEKKTSRTNGDGLISLTYVNEKCKVTINPKTGILIQTNPVPRRKKK